MTTRPMMFKKYRHDFSETCKIQLAKFAEANKKLHRKKYKELWNEWVIDNKNMVELECNKLKENGFEGDALDKMYKSVRYYHRKKDKMKKQETMSQEKRTYIRLSVELQKCMENHITEMIMSNTTDDNGEISLTHGYAFHNFIKRNTDFLLRELVEIKRRDGFLEENMSKKLQKRYRDKFYTQRSKMMNNIHV